MANYLEGKVCLVTGGSSGIGLAIAKAFARSGAEVIILARDPDRLESAATSIRELGADVLALTCDVADFASIKAAWSHIEQEGKNVDVLVNNAGSAVAMPFENISDDLWHDDFDLKVMAAIRLSNLVIPSMKKKGWGRILNILSISAKTPIANTAPSSVNRAAGMALTKVLSGELAPHGILVNALLAGMIDTGILKARYEAAQTDMTYEDWVTVAAKSANIPLQRPGSAEELAAMACFLCSDQQGYITGAAINFDGGRSPVP